jgi:hypothetical protein
MMSLGPRVMMLPNVATRSSGACGRVVVLASVSALPLVLSSCLSRSRFSSRYYYACSTYLSYYQHL